MRICYFGTYDKDRPRNRIIIQGLRENGIEVVECHYSVWRGIEDKSQVISFWSKIKVCLNFIRSYFVLIVKYFNIGKHNAIMVGYLGHFDMFVAKLLAIIRYKPLYFDVFLSLYNTIVFDRKLINPRNPVAKIFYYLDKISCQLADKVFLDTKAHIDYFVETFGLRRDKFYRVFVGAEEDVFYPVARNEISKDNRSVFNILFYGQFIPLQGVEYIVKAAKLLETEDNIKFTIIGKGQEHSRIGKMANDLDLKNIAWIDWVKYEELLKYINTADICLGIFGDTDKSRRVIPNKAFQIIASRKPLITGDSPASRELFTDRQNAVLCEIANPEAIAEAILLLKNNIDLRNKIAEKGYAKFTEKCSMKIIEKEVLFALKKKR